MTVAASYTANLTVTESLPNQPLVNLSSDSVQYSGLNTSLSLSGTSTPPASVVGILAQALTSGAATIDLTNVPGTNGVAVSGNGLKIRAVKFANPASNANPITIKFGAANPYLLFGASWSIILQPGQEFLAYLKDAAPAIGSGSKNIDLAGTGTQVLNVLILMG